jgi:OFA family oxalate/formate antiporter-like MFS transporter
MTTQVAVNDTLTQAVVKEDFIQKRKFYLAIGFLMCLIMGLVYAWSIFVLPLEKQFGWTRAQTQLTFTLTIIMFSFGNIFGGRLADRFGPRMVASAGAVLTTIGFFLASYTTSLIMLYFSYGILVGLGIGVAYICVISLAARWYPDRRGLAAGVVTMGFGLAGFLLGGIVGYFINSLGWQWAFRTLGLASAILMVGGALLIRFPPPNWSPVPVQNNQQGPPRVIKNFEWFEMIKTTPFCLWFLSLVALLSAGLMILAHVVPLAVEKGLSKGDAAWAMGMFALFNGLGRLVFGWLYDKLGQTKAMVLDGVVMTVGVFGILYMTQVVGLSGLFVAIMSTGLAYGGCPAINIAFIVNAYGAKNAGINIGLATTPLMIAVIIGPYLGSFAQMSYGYDYTIFLGGLFALVSAIVPFFVGDPQKLYKN